MGDRFARATPGRAIGPAGGVGAATAAVVLPVPEAPLPLAVTIVGAVVALAWFWAPAFALLSDAGEAVGLDHGYAFALTNLAWAAGQVLGGAAGGSVAERAGDAVPYAALALLCSLTMAALALGRRPRARAGV